MFQCACDAGQAGSSAIDQGTRTWRSVAREMARKSLGKRRSYAYLKLVEVYISTGSQVDCSIALLLFSVGTSRNLADTVSEVSYPRSASASSLLRLGLCLSFFACFLFSARFTGGGAPSTARDAAFTALVAVNFFSFFFFGTIAI
jgi:hypothetical protein